MVSLLLYKKQLHQVYGSDASEFIDALLHCVELLPKLDAETRTAYGFRIYCEIGFGYIEGQGFSKMQSAIMQKPIACTRQKRRAGAYQAGCYLNLCLINKNYKRAESLFRDFLERYFRLELTARCNLMFCSMR